MRIKNFFTLKIIYFQKKSAIIKKRTSQLIPTSERILRKIKVVSGLEKFLLFRLYINLHKKMLNPYV